MKEPFIGVDEATGKDKSCIVRGHRNADGTIKITSVRYPIILECPKCNYAWPTRVKQPKLCPKCKKRLAKRWSKPTE